MPAANPPATMTEPQAGGLRNAVGIALFMAFLWFYWITLTPFVDLRGEAILDPSAGNSNALNQIISLLLFFVAAAYGVTHPMRSIILQPRVLIGVIYGWFIITALLSAHPLLGIKGAILGIMITLNASIVLLLPPSERHFAKMMGIGMLIMLATSYAGILFMPTLSIHQASELREPMNAGLWRGHFPHKNSAAAAMVIAAFFGFYVFRSWSRLAGVIIIVLSALFLMKTGGKTSSAMLPATLIVAWAFERFRLLRIPIAVGGVFAFNFIAVGAAVMKPLSEFLTSIGIDATFTNRSDIWRFAFDAMAERPLTGHGFRAFWQTEELVYSGGNVETWAVAAANGHNSYLDIALAIGIPGLILTLVWIMFLPLRDISRIPKDKIHSPLTRLFMRVWLYTLFNAGLETIFYEGGNLLWFTFLFSIYGFRLQASAHLSEAGEPVPKGRILAHA